MENFSLEHARNLNYSVFRMHRRLRNESLSTATFTFSEETVLAQLLAQPRQTGAELARFQQMTPQSMNAIVKSLLARGYILAGKNLLDKRRKELYLTDRGTALITAIRAEREEWILSRVGESLTEEETDLLVETLPLLRKIVDRETKAERLARENDETASAEEGEEDAGAS